MANVHTLAAAPITGMLDDQKTTVHWTPKDASGNVIPLPPGESIVNSVSDATATILSGVTAGPPGGAGVPDPLAVAVMGVKGIAGDPTVLGSVTNPDGSVATGSAPFHITIDPAELKVADLGVVVDTPTAQ